MSFLQMLATEEQNSFLLAGDKKEIYWGSAAFFLLMALVIWKATPLLAKAMRDRTERVQSELDEARSEREQAERSLEADTSDLPDPKVRDREMRVEAVQTAEKLKVDMLAKAQAEADAVRERGRADVANLRRQAQADLSAAVSKMTRDSAEAVVMSGLNDQSQGELIDNYINQVSQMS